MKGEMCAAVYCPTATACVRSRPLPLRTVVSCRGDHDHNARLP